MFAFDEATHTYTLDGETLPSVTQILRAEGFINHAFTDPWYAERGKAVHKATELYDLGTLDESTIDPCINGYIDAWKKYLNDTRYSPELSLIEKPFYHPVRKYAGTIDRKGKDIKSGAPEAWHVLQASAYEDLLLVNTDYVSRGWEMIYLQEDGNYKVKTFSAVDLYHARQIFNAALSCHIWKKNNRIGE